jgi:hypothetical protein
MLRLTKTIVLILGLIDPPDANVLKNKRGKHLDEEEVHASNAYMAKL